MADEKKKKSEMITCKVLRDFWDAEGERVAAGSIVDVDPITAVDGCTSGALERVK